MTDRAAPGAQGSTVRNVEYGEMGGAPAPFILPEDEGTIAGQRWSALDMDSVKNGEGYFSIRGIGESTSNELEIRGGEGFVDGWFATDETKTTSDLSTYQQERVTIVVGWDPDAVYSSDVHANREEADSVFVEAEPEVSDDKPYIPIWNIFVVQHPDGGFVVSRDHEIRDLRPIGRPMESLSSGVTSSTSDGGVTKGPGLNLLRGRPTTFTGGVSIGPQEASINALRDVFERAPVDDQATQGDVSLLTMLESAGMPSAYMERTLDGQGGAYGHKLEAGLGRLARINANLSWQYDSLADVPNWESASGSESNWTFNVNGRPRRIHVEQDGTGASDDNGGVTSSSIVDNESLDAFRIVFHDVSFTENSPDDRLFVGITDQAPNTSIDSNGNGVLIRYNGTFDTDFLTITSGTTASESMGAIDWSSNHDLSIEYDGSDVRAYVDGEFRATTSYSTTADFSPSISLDFDQNGGTNETLEVEQVSVEPLPEVLN